LGLLLVALYVVVLLAGYRRSAARIP